MINWNNLTFEARMNEWRTFRESITTYSEDTLNDVAKFFASFPISSRVLDYYNQDTWFTPWEILKNSFFCRSSISLLIYHTLMMSNHDINIKLMLINDGTEIYLVPIIDDTTIINYNIGSTISIEEIKDSIKIIETFKPESY